MNRRDIMDVLEEAMKIGKSVILKGNVATYIPELAKADKHKLGICLHTVDGSFYNIGDYEERFTIQSISKVITLCKVLEEFGAEYVFKFVGMEPSGEAFNSLVELDLKHNRPFNPMINSGAITVASMLLEKCSFEDMLVYTKKVCLDDQIGLDMATFQSEMAHSSRNRAISYLLESKGIIKANVEDSLKFYTQMCSLTVSAKSLANFGLILATDGVNPENGERLISSWVARTVKTIMLTCGMYDGSGEFAVLTGIPTKSGVGGGLVSVANAKLGIGVYGPALDDKGNCIAGCELLKYVSKHLDLHMFNISEWEEV
ncbi:glutaminase A [uncultured Clostridium sp.]|uniref:glutaminase A n=2 Tax=uncultured Clostridium sp. TaxID=59620 RepID=UPI0025D61760|nr:glutaminase A [uncultured Clostridium sp.]